MGKNLRITGARRDFLRMVCNSVLIVRDNGGKFLFYEISGQIHKKIARRNFMSLVYHGYLYKRGITDDGGVVYDVTDKARRVVYEGFFDGGSVL